jgi:hypothetical protein
VFDHLVSRCRDLFNASFDVPLYDLTSTYFEASPPFPENINVSVVAEPRPLSTVSIACRVPIRIRGRKFHFGVMP